jgi:hypothetical protein
MLLLSYIQLGSFINFCYHKDDFGMDVEWQFFAALHVMHWENK